MLNKRFKIAKCKTSLKLATSRIKLMRNKKGVQIIQMKKELAQLLESGQDRTARIRVEHVIREEKLVAAYDLIEIYCELIVARLPIIESQKTCPIDLKEAVTSVIFAAPRCSDITELVDVRKNFTAKYGKDFVSAALELRPDCGVNRMLVEKLSAVAPDLQAKMKVLSAVAKEHNISWNPTSFEEKESKPPGDLLNGPTNLEKENAMYVDPKIQTPDFQNVHSHEGIPNVPLDFSQQNRRFTLDAQNETTADSNGIQLSASANHDDIRPTGMTFGMMNMKQPFNSNSDDSWNMEFKDATSAAQAAAESAERASIAARAAAQLSSQGKITRQYSTESQKSHIREEQPQVSITSEYPGQGQFKYAYNASFNNRKPMIHNEHMDPSAKSTSPKATKGSSSLRSRNGSVDKSSVNHIHQADGYFETNEDQTHSSPEISLKTESRDRFTSGNKEGFTFPPSRSHSSRAGDESDLLTSDSQNVGKRTVLDQGNLSGIKKGSPYGDANRDDETDSDDDDPGRLRFDMGFEYDEGEAKLFFPSPDRETIHPLENSQISSPKRNSSKSVDLSNGPDSESESETEKSRFSGRKKFTSPRKHGLLSTHPEPVYVEPSPNVNSRKSRIELNDLVESESEMGKPSLSETKKFTSLGKHNLFSKHQVSSDVESSPKVNSSQSQIELDDLVKKDSDFLNQSDDLDTGEELKFETLTGDLRKNGRKYPPYTESASPSSKKSVEESTIKGNSTSKHSINLRAGKLVNKKMNVSTLSSESDSDEFSVQPLKSKSQFAPPDAFFNRDEIDLEEDIPKRMSSGKVHLGSGLSRRTKGQAEPKANTITFNQSPAKGRSYTENFRKNSDSSTESKTSSISAERKSSTPFKQEAFRTMPEPKIYETPPSPPKMMAESGKTEEPKTTNLTSNSLPGETNNIKKPSHVHPKLPDYDSLAARIQALQKTNRQ
uniref:uncharacterized protein LOC122598815 n=1 Tax=Erigeron canadensis TaxID=72917 RepID=UPI001CB9696C|nr:uncharacterized protein LOC122598815 [Erigeron canadensis]